MIYCRCHQDDWGKLPPFPEFMYNNPQKSSAKTSRFLDNYAYHPRCKMTNSINPTNPAAENFVAKL